MSDDWKVQASYRFGEGDLLNVRGDGAGDLKSQLENLVAVDAIETVVTVGQLVRGVTAAAPILQTPEALIPPTNVSPLDAYRNAPATPVEPAPAAVAPQAPAMGAKPRCVHGEREYVSKVGTKGPWQAWMCPAKKDDPTKCEPQWIR